MRPAHACMLLLLFLCAHAAAARSSRPGRKASISKAMSAVMSVNTTGRCDPNVKTALANAFTAQLKGKGASSISIGAVRCRGIRSSSQRRVLVGATYTVPATYRAASRLFAAGRAAGAAEADFCQQYASICSAVVAATDALRNLIGFVANGQQVLVTDGAIVSGPEPPPSPSPEPPGPKPSPRPPKPSPKPPAPKPSPKPPSPKPPPPTPSPKPPTPPPSPSPKPSPSPTPPPSPSPKPSPSPSPSPVPAPSPSPSPAPVQPRLALLSSFPASYAGPTANLTATASTDACTKAPSPRLGNVTLVTPGPGQCGANGTVAPGTYTLAQTAAAGTAFDRWECYNITAGVAGAAVNVSSSITLSFGQSVTCVAVYSVLAAPPLPRLALISSVTGNWSGPGGNLTAAGANATCVQAPSGRLSSNNASILAPGPNALCNGNGSMPVGSYSLSQAAPAGTNFERWECYNVTTGVVVGLVNGTNVTLQLSSFNTSITCVAVYSVIVPPLPRLALISSFPNNFTGFSGSVSAAGPSNSTCMKLPAPILGVNSVSIVSPGAGLCGANGSVAAGTYNLTHSPPNNFVLQRFECYSISNGTAVGPGIGPTVTLQAGQVVTCVAEYAAAPRLALLSAYPSGFAGPGANLTASSASSNSSCTEAPSQRLGVNNVSITAPGLGFCFGQLEPGTYSLSQSATAGTAFQFWQCWNITSGNATGPFNGSNVNIQLNTAWTCVANYLVGGQLSQLALLSDYPAAYSGPAANLTAAGPSNATCNQSPSQRLGVNNVSITNPGAGACFGNSSAVPGVYLLSQTTPVGQGLVFDRWLCYDITNGTAGPPFSPVIVLNTTNGNLTGNSTGNSTVARLNLGSGASIVCVAAYVAAPPKLALLSSYPAEYNGTNADLAAVGPTGLTCIQMPSARLGVSNVTVTSPAAGTCPAASTAVPGVYTLQQITPAATLLFRRWECYYLNGTNGTATGPFTPTAVVPDPSANTTGANRTVLGALQLNNNEVVTCVAVYSLISPSLALISNFSASYTGPTANLSSTGPNHTLCLQAPSQRIGVNGVTVQSPGPGVCPASSTAVPGLYQLSQLAPPGVNFSSWQCFLVATNGTAADTLLNMTGNSSTPAVSVRLGDSVTCVAVYSSSPPTPPAPGAGTRLALLSSLPSNYQGVGANLTATATNSTSCVQAPSHVLGVSGVNITAPGTSQCGWPNGTALYAGNYSLVAGVLAELRFTHWECYDISNGTAVAYRSINFTIDLAPNKSTTCLAVYEANANTTSPSPSPSPSPDVSPAPSMSPSPSPSPSPDNVSPSPSPSPSPPPVEQYELVLFTSMPANYTGPRVNISAVGVNGTNDTCTKAPALINGTDGVSLANTAPASCGLVHVGSYTVTAPQSEGTLEFAQWQCYYLGGALPPTLPGQVENVAAFTLYINFDTGSVACVAEYRQSQSLLRAGSAQVLQSRLSRSSRMRRIRRRQQSQLATAAAP